MSSCALHSIVWVQQPAKGRFLTHKPVTQQSKQQDAHFGKRHDGILHHFQSAIYQLLIEDG